MCEGESMESFTPHQSTDDTQIQRDESAHTENAPTVSVILPCYNVATTLTPCVDSITAGSFQSYEIIMVDDGSPDETGSIADALASHDPRLRVIHKHNGGVASARNAGMDAARGRYLLFVDPDDTVEPRFLSAMVELMDSSGADYGTCNFLRRHEGDVWKPFTVFPGRTELTSNADIITRYFPKVFAFSREDIMRSYRGAELYGSWGGVFNHAYSREVCVANNIRFDETWPLREDTMFNCAYMLYAQHMAVTPEQLYRYAPDGDGLMASTDHSKSALKLRFNMLAARKTIVRKLVDEHAMRYQDAIDLMCGTTVLSLFRMIQLICALGLSFTQGMTLIKRYLADADVRASIRRFPLGMRLKTSLPVVLLKIHAYSAVYASMFILAKAGLYQ